MRTFVYGTKTIEYEVQRGSRKNVTITVSPNQTVIVKIPKEMPEDEIESVVAKKAYWITQQQFLMKDIQVVEYQKDYVNGECFLYLGRRYMLELRLEEQIKTPYVKLYRGKLIVTTNSRNSEIIRPALIRWYKERAQEIIERRISYYERVFEQKRGRIIIKEQKKRWASCGKNGDLMINWKIVMAPTSVIDYVIVHELCHLVHRNHSKDYWNEVGRVLPDYEQYKNWLMNHGIELKL